MPTIFGTGIEIDPRLKEMLDGLQKVDSVVIETIWDKTLELAFGEEDVIKEGIPVDTGRAKASWGHFTPGDLIRGSHRLGTGKKVTKRTKYLTGEGSGGRAQIAAAGDAIWEEDEANLTVTQGTQVPYTPYLNDGTSTRAALMFVDQGEEWANNQMQEFSESVFAMVESVLMKREAIRIPQMSFRRRIPKR